jgi:hypothetical protein
LINGRRTRPATRHRGKIGELAQLEIGRLRIPQSEMGRELVAELSAFEVNHTPTGNLTVDVRARDHHGDLVMATALALWSAVGRPPGRTEIGKLENYSNPDHSCHLGKSMPRMALCLRRIARSKARPEALHNKRRDQLRLRPKR